MKIEATYLGVMLFLAMAFFACFAAEQGLSLNPAPRALRAPAAFETDAWPNPHATTQVSTPLREAANY